MSGKPDPLEEFLMVASALLASVFIWLLVGLIYVAVTQY